MLTRDTGDVIDRYSIARLKGERIGNNENKKEYETFGLALQEIIGKHPNVPLLMFSNLLYKINTMIWDLESDLRQGKLDGALSEVGRRAIEIREHNNLRVQIKNIINFILQEGFQDIKFEHVSGG